MAPKQTALKPRTVPLSVLNLSFSKTGTASMRAALETLGYPTYHGQVQMERPQDHGRISRAIDAKFYGKGKPFGREEFDDLWGEFGALSDVPCIGFADELVEAYPEAKVVLVERPVDQWFPSYDTQVISSRVAPLALITQYLLEPLIPGGGPATNMTKIHFAMFHAKNQAEYRAHAKQTYLEHNKHIRALMKGRENRFLVFELGSGWGPLCAFLGKEVPNVPFPKVNEREEFQKTIKRIMEKEVQKGLKFLMWRFMPALLAILVAWWVYYMGFFAATAR